MENRTTRTWQIAAYVLYGFLCTILLYFTSRENFIQLIAIYAGMFALYFLLARCSERTNYLGEIIIAGILLRLVATFAVPNLTDDHFRFLWDGQLVTHGFNPYASIPEQVRAEGYFGISTLDDHLFNSLNSAQYISIYPPIAQAIYAIGALIGGSNWDIQILVIKIILLAFECGTIFLLPKVLKQLHINVGHAAWYILNPLIIVELSGNMHLESTMVFFSLLSIYYFNKNNLWLSAISFGLAIATKLWPLMLMPLLFRQIGFKQTIRYSVIAGVTAIIFLLPMLIEFSKITGSFNLYFQQFEFNASIFYIGKYFFDKNVNYEAFSNMRGSLPFIAAFLILVFSAVYKKQYWYAGMLIAFSIYLLLATTVHPWYLAPLILLSVLSGLRYPILWSLLIYLSYYTYITPAYIENMTFVWIEYVMVIGFAAYELIHSPMIESKIITSRLPFKI